MKVDYLDNIKKFEGFTGRAQWDFAQHSNGFGTKARYPGEVIDKVEAEQRFATEIATARAAVARFAPDLDEGTAAALTSLTFNAGPGWMRQGLGAAIKAGDLEGAKQVFVQYVNAGGQRLAGLEARRAVEVQWIGQQQSTAPHINRDVSRVHSDTTAVADVKDTSSDQIRERAVVVAENGVRPAAREGSLDTGAGEALAHVLLVETIGIVLAARRSQHDRDDRDLERLVRI